MKRQRSFGDGPDDDRRRFYDRGPPPPRRAPREYDGDRFDRRKGFGGGFQDGRYREYPSPREYGGDRAMHRSESFSGFRREFPKGFRSERDRSRRDGDGSSAWRRPGSGWREAECFDEYRAPARMGAASLAAQPQQSRSRSRSPSEPRRRFEVARAEKLKKQMDGVGEMEEGEVAPDAEPKARPAAVEHRKRVEPSRAKEKGPPDRGKVKKLDSETPEDLGAQGKGATRAGDTAGKEDDRRINGMLAASGKPVDKGSERSSLKVDKEVSGGHEVQAQDVVTSDASTFGLSTSPIQEELMQVEVKSSPIQEEVMQVEVKSSPIQEGVMQEQVKSSPIQEDVKSKPIQEDVKSSPIQEEVMQVEVKRQEETTSSVDVVEQSASSSILKKIIKEEATTREEPVDENDVRKSATSSSSQGALQEEVSVLHKTCSAVDDGKITSPIVRNIVLQEEALALDSTVYAIHEVGRSASSSMPREVLQEEIMQIETTAIAVDQNETDTSSDPLQEATQEKMTTLDETAHSMNTPEPVNYSGMLKEAMHEGELTMDATANASGVLKEAMHEGELTMDATGNATGVAGQSNLSDMAEDAMHEKAAVPEGTINFVTSTGESNTLTGPQREAIASLPLQALESKEFEKLTVIGEMDKPKEYVAFQPAVDIPQDQCGKRGASKETMIGEIEAAVFHKNIEKQVNGFDIEARPDDAHMFHRSTKEHDGDGKKDTASANLMTTESSANLMTTESMAEDKGNGIAFDVLSKKVKVDHCSSVGRGLDSALQLGTELTGTLKSASAISVKQENDTMKPGKLDLSLSLSGCLIPKTASLAHAACPLTSSSFRTNSDGFTASISLTSSQTLGHNPSCSLTQQSLDNYEQSVGSKPFPQISNFTGRRAQLSSQSKQKGNATPLLQRVLQNDHMPDSNTLAGIEGHNNGISNDLRSHADIPGVLSPTYSRGSHDSGLEYNRHRRQLTRERSSSSLTRGEWQEGEQLVINGAGVIERIISKVVSEPLHLTGRMLHDMTENSITYLREAISEIIVDPNKRGQIIALQEALKKRSDLNSDMLRTCPRVLMEILVAIRTGLPYFIKKSSSVATSDLVDIFLNLKCRNLSCQSILPVDDCDCKVCQRKTGFCSSCMCIVCSKFDSASNTCSWVGCDVCLHWCHTDCGLRHSLIRKGESASRAYGTFEMQFHCAACGHPSEMFGFVKEVFRTCARQWRMETLIRELQYVERIFCASDDVRGKRVRDFVKQMLIKSENKAYHPEIVKCVIAFFSDDDTNLGINPSVPLKGIPCSIAETIDVIPSSSRKAAWAPFTLEGLPVLDKTSVLPTTRSPSVHRNSDEAEFRTINNKAVIDELDSLIRLKQAEAYMYQERANDARNEVDNLRRIVMVKNARIEEDYATQIADLDINKLQEQRKRKIEELQVIERTHHEYLSMKTRMVASIGELLSKMEALKQNRST